MLKYFFGGNLDTLKIDKQIQVCFNARTCTKIHFKQTYIIKLSVTFETDYSCCFDNTEDYLAIQSGWCPWLRNKLRRDQ